MYRAMRVRVPHVRQHNRIWLQPVIRPLVLLVHITCIINVRVSRANVPTIQIHQRRVVNVRVLVVRRIIRHVPLGGHPVVVIHLMNCAVQPTNVVHLVQQLMVRFIVLKILVQQPVVVMVRQGCRLHI